MKSKTSLFMNNFLGFASLGLLILLFVGFELFILSGSCVIFYYAYNYVGPKLFDFNTITFLNSFILTVAISSIRVNPFALMREFYNEIFNNSKDSRYENEKKDDGKFSKVLKVVGSIILGLLCYVADIYFFQYSWNTIVPELIHKALPTISFLDSFAIIVVLGYIFGRKGTSSNSNKEKQ